MHYNQKDRSAEDEYHVFSSISKTSVYVKQFGNDIAFANGVPTTAFNYYTLETYAVALSVKAGPAPTRGTIKLESKCNVLRFCWGKVIGATESNPDTVSGDGAALDEETLTPCEWHFNRQRDLKKDRKLAFHYLQAIIFQLPPFEWIPKEEFKPEYIEKILE